jgi:hypothetical protein
MRNSLFGLCLAFAFMVPAAQALPLPTPLYTCYLDAMVTHDNGFTFGLRKIDVEAVGKMNCIGWKATSQNVSVSIKGLGLGPEIAGPVTRIRMATDKSGISSPRAMYGKYSLQVSPNVQLIGVRLGASGGAELNPHQEVAAKVSISLENSFGLGFDVSGAEMTIKPLKNN